MEEINFVLLNGNQDCNDNGISEQLPCPGPSDAYNIFGDPEVFPRVGEEYQVKIPSLMTRSDYIELTNSGCGYDFRVGLPVQIILVSKEIENIKQESPNVSCNTNAVSRNIQSVETKCAGETPMSLLDDDLKPKAELTDEVFGEKPGLVDSDNLGFEQETKIHKKQNGTRELHVVPGLMSESWSDIEESSFLLGLYIFGKNLTQVMQFLESKAMGSILSYYYGNFYGSENYQRWSECRKIRSRKCIYGQKIFTGLRQQELLSRLFPRVSEECQNKLVEIAKSFAEGKMLLEEYVSALKGAVGLSILVEAVGIGQGKQDLTGIAVEPLKPNQFISIRPEIPVGKAFSNLTTVEIVNFLTGDFRLSKARSGDLFWEAVWPRLLARGWHSEQPKDLVCVAGFRNSLVFLIPGIKKFSRRRLVKGEHYFDSVSDVLRKVASDPGLIDLETEAEKGSRAAEENGWTSESKVGLEDSPDKKRRCYLKPRTPSRDTNVMKFTVVDTSLAEGGTFKVRELRGLPIEIVETLRSSKEEEEDDDNSETESNSADSSCLDEDEARMSHPTKSLNNGVSSTEERKSNSNTSDRVNGPDATTLNANSLEDESTVKRKNVEARKSLKGQLSWRPRPGHKNQLPPVSKKRRRLTACERTERSRAAVNSSLAAGPKQPETIICSETQIFSENSLSQLESPHKKEASLSSSSKEGPVVTGEGINKRLGSDSEHSQEGHEPLTSVDLNLSNHLATKSDEPHMVNAAETQNNESGQIDESSNMKTSDLSEVRSELQPDMNARRHSTRNRPLTMKALEALASGFLGTTTRKRNSQDDFCSRPSRRARAKLGATENFDAAVEDWNGGESKNDGSCKGNGEMLGKLQV